ncbi:hypothetical protein N657DRAFT_639136 [Parathielavia appendiculata]|uniref:Uncharacterized protein n=1 Tax=Parathielavia appendiculata TaxID=2587402 RepID=A0AAN6U9R9_9PEZI|nr:hypothetical protein N657DRAFT_639136 [Parathielavia appendiculata]
MLTPNKLAISAAWLLLLGATSAAERAAVDSSDVTTTITTVLTTTTGVPTLLSTAPNDATDSVLSTTTGAARPAPTNQKGAAELAACHNTDGEFRPFCLPKHNDVYYPDSMHYITWDPSFFPGANTTLKLIGFYTNTSEPTPTNAGPPTGEERAFSSEDIEAGWGLYEWHIPGSLLSRTGHELINITLHMVALPKGAARAQWLTGPTITLRWKPKPPPAPKPPKNSAQELYIALPLVFGFAVLMIVGTFFMNRQIRRIGVGNVITRTRRGAAGVLGRRKGGNGVGASKRDRARNQDKELGIRLMERDGAVMESDEERAGSWEEGWGSQDSGGAGRRVFERVGGKRD